MSAEAVPRIVEAGRREVIARVRAALEAQASQAGLTDLDEAALDRVAGEAATRADGTLWRRALAGAAADELGIGLGEAVDHPLVIEAQALAGAPAYEPPAHEQTAPHEEAAASDDLEPVALVDPTAPPESALQPAPAPAQRKPDALRLAAVHLGGIESLRAGERDLELRLSSAGLDVLKRSSGAAIGRLQWAEIETVDLPRPRRGIRARRQELHVATARGRASFELPELTDQQLHDHLEPMLERSHGRIGS